MENDYFIATQKDDFQIYASEMYRLSENDFLNLIKICLVEARSKSIGRKLVAIYKDSIGNTNKLKLIGVKDDGETKPTSRKKPTLR